eukprot:scaffold14647_cov77-Skeletonema_marinoi.AAC.1
MWLSSVWWVKEVEVLKKLKLAIFGVQAKSDPPTAIISADRRSTNTRELVIQSCRQTASRGALAAIDSIMDEEIAVASHLPLLEELIKFQLADRQHDLANNHVAGSTLPDDRYPTAAFNNIHPRTLPPHLAA